MRASLTLAAIAAAQLALCAASTTFYVMGDWGGQEAAPYTTPAETKVRCRSR
jgi:hypothetical protein